MTNNVAGLELSRNQQEFAERMECGLAMGCVDQSVCFYRVIGQETVRWIVDADGTVVDWTVFHSWG